uniref:(California timema) hypothetical protein n=1 Tax=Timema californicum TaxID=61474 RepID=A0A7R9JJ15_TIMCA|nr:unnamed protein product [Timema californicum]
MDWFALNQDRIAPYAGPGHWNDPDMCLNWKTPGRRSVSLQLWHYRCNSNRMYCSLHLLRYRLPSSRIKTKLKLRMCEELDPSCNATVVTVLIIGDYGLSYEQSKTQMAVWAILAAPLLLSTDIAAVKKHYKEILQNKDILAVNQDPLGIQGKRVYMDDSNTTQVWTRAISPKKGDQFSYAVALVSGRTDGIPHPFSVSLEEIGLNNTAGYIFKLGAN